MEVTGERVYRREEEAAAAAASAAASSREWSELLRRRAVGFCWDIMALKEERPAVAVLGVEGVVPRRGGGTKWEEEVRESVLDPVLDRGTVDSSGVEKIWPMFCSLCCVT